MTRRPVAAFLDDPDVIVVCDDGTTWGFSRERDEWSRLAAIPGSPAAKKERRKERDREDREAKAPGKKRARTPATTDDYEAPIPEPA